jgi:DNA mismatch endonuclease, patch repair protein
VEVETSLCQRGTVTRYRPKPRDEIARNMAAIRSTENRTETALRKRLHALGLRYRLYARDLPGRPDIVFPSSRVAVFVDGDYWHCRILVENGLAALKASLRTASRNYWLAKFQHRVSRDVEVTMTLRQMGWLVIRLWESDVKRDTAKAAARVERAVRRRRDRTRSKQ